VVGGTLRGERVELDVGGDLDLVSVQDWQRTRGFSVSGGVLLTPIPLPESFGLGQVKGNRSWSEVSEIVGRGDTVIRVGGNLDLKASTIASETGKLDLKAGSLSFSDHADVDTDLDWSFGVSGLSKVLNGTTLPGLKLDYESRNMRGTTYATLGEGRIVIGDRPGKTGPSGEILENPLALGTINRDPQGRQVVTINESTKVSLDIPVLDFRKIADDARSATDLMRALTTPVPDDVAAQGEAATDYYRRLIAGGATPEIAAKLLNDEQIQKLVGAKERWDRAVEYWGGAEFVPEKLALRIARGDNVDVTDPTASMECGGSGTSAPCFYNPQPGLSRADVEAHTKAVFREAAEEYKQIYARVREAVEAGRTPDKEDILKLEIQKEVMQSAYAANALCRGSNMGMWSEYLREFGLDALGNSHRLALASALEREAQSQLGYARDEQIKRLQADLGTFVKTAVHLTPVVGAVIDGYNLYQDLTTGQYFAAGVDGALLAVSLVGGAFIVKGILKAGEKVAVVEGAELLNVSRLSAESVENKLAGYLLNPAHAGAGASKAKWFEEALGFNKSNMHDLAKQIVFDEVKATPTIITQFGQKFNQVISITGVNGRVIDVNFAWIKNNDGIVRLVTGIPAKK
jgi:hypothetical protein